VFLASELEMCYAALCYVTNYAEGVVERPFRAEELFGGLSTDDEKKRVARAVDKFPEIIAKLAVHIEGVNIPCHCSHSMQRYKVEGRIGEDWRDWIET